MNQDERYIRMKEHGERRKKIMEEWRATHPEGITAKNLKEAQAFFKKRDKELKVKP